MIEAAHPRSQRYSVLNIGFGYTANYPESYKCNYTEFCAERTRPTIDRTLPVCLTRAATLLVFTIFVWLRRTAMAVENLPC